MKKVLLMLLLFLGVNQVVFAQSMDDFIRNEGGKLLAELAHPTNTFESGNFSVSASTITVNVYYEGGYYTSFEITRQGGFFTNIRIVADNDEWVSPFFMISVLKDLAIDLFQSDPETVSKIEQQIGKELSDMDGEELACLILTAAWFGY